MNSFTHTYMEDTDIMECLTKKKTTLTLCANDTQEISFPIKASEYNKKLCTDEMIRFAIYLYNLFSMLPLLIRDLRNI